MKKFLTMMLTLVFAVSAWMPGAAAADTRSEDVVILYTNDVHTYIDGALSYDVIAALKQELQKQYRYVLLADAGDHIQGTAYGSMDQGKTMIQLMNAAGYDVATLGNHEFDYAMEGCMQAIALADFPYVSANFYREENGVRGENVLDSYVMFDCGAEKVAFVGITTPETFGKSTPAYFQDENGNFIYGISAGADGAAMQQDVQRAVDAAKEAGATKVIALGHLGIDPSSQPWTSTETIAATEGIDAFIDGHSHSTVEGESVRNKNGESVLLTQTGSYFERIGMMVIDAETDAISTDFIEWEATQDQNGGTTGYRLVSDTYDGATWVSDETVRESKEAWMGEIDQKLGEIIGESTVILDNYDADGNRLVRSMETNSGDFAADALYYLFDAMDMEVDVAMMNGGGIRNTAITGALSYKICKDMHTFGNVACLQEVRGQQLLDALEWGARKIGAGENGGFMQVSGMTYRVDTATESTLTENEVGAWVAAPQHYRVYDVKIYNKETDCYETLDLNKTYRLAGYNYTLRNLGDGYTMFDGAVNVLDYVMEDYMVLANYVRGFENGMVGAKNSPLAEKYPGLLLDYGTVNGSGRIAIGERSAAFADMDASAWYAADVAYVNEKGLMRGVTETTFAPNETVTRGMLATVLYRAEGKPEENKSKPFSDVQADSYYADAVNWAQQNGIVNGVSETEFAPEDAVTREQIAAMLFRYATYKGKAPSGAWAIRLPYADVADISDYAAEGVMYCTLQAIMQGDENNRFAPQTDATRAEIAAVLHRMMQTIE